MTHLFKKDKQRQADGASSPVTGLFSPLGKDNVTSSSGKDSSTFYDAPSSTASNSPSSKSSTLKQHPKPVVSSSTIAPATLQLSHIHGVKAAATAAGQIEEDIVEVRTIIANYAVEPLEMLHLVDRWLQQLLGEFLQQRDHFKHKLLKKWQNQELTNINYDNNDRIRKTHAACKELEQARDTILSHESFDELHRYLGKSDDDKTGELKEKCNALIQHYLKIVQCIEFVDKEIKVNAGDNSISEMKKNLLRLKELNNKPSHTICIVGLEKAGKSTFINALLGFELLPTASERCTQIRTVLKPLLEDDDQHLFATVKFYDDQEFRLFFDKMTKKTDENEQQLQQRKAGVVLQRDILQVKFPEEQFRIDDSSDPERQRKVIINHLHDYITGELFVNIIKEIAIYTDKLPGKNYELLDVPGFDSPIKEHRDAGLKAVKSADAFLFLTNGQQPSLTEPQIRLLREIQQNHYEAMQRAFGIITKLDLCQTPAKYQEHHEKAYGELIEKHFKPERIYAACPRLEIIDNTSEEYRVIDRKLQSFSDDLIQGFQRSKDGLNKFIEYELPKTHLKQLIELGETRLSRHVLNQLQKIKEKQLLPQNMTTASIDEYIKQQDIENWDQIYSKDIYEPVFARANQWHTTIVTTERAKFVEDVKQTFHDCFLDLTKEFARHTHQIEQIMSERYGFGKLQLNVHPIDNDAREKLSFELEKIVDKTSNILAEYFYHKYVCEMENMLNDICPQLRDLYRTKLSLEKCTNETHALILRVCRPVIMATLRYSYLDFNVKQDAINELIYIAPTVAFNIMKTAERDGNSGGILGKEILKSVESSASANETTSLVKSLFKK